MEGKITSKFIKITRGLAWGTMAAGLFAVILAFLPYSLFKNLLDGLASDGNAEIFTPLLHSGLRWVPGMLGLALLAFGTALWLHPQTLTWLRNEWQQAGPDLRHLIQDCNPANLAKRERWLLAGIMAMYLTAAVTLSLRSPLRYDEAYTYMEFARHSLSQVISDYHVVNNHIFHTFLAHLSTRLFGNSWLAIRLPAMTAGLLLVPGLYTLGKQLYDEKIGLAAAGIFSLTPVLMVYATSARGYTLVMLFTVWAFLLALRLQTGPDRAAWLLLVICGAFGVWTIPVMMYPLAAIYLWLFIQAIVQPPNGVTFLRRLADLAASGIAMIALALVLYTPAFGKDWLAGFLMRNAKTALPPAEFWARIGGWTQAAFIEWLDGFPAILAGLLMIGLAASLLLHTRISHWRTPLLPIVVIALSIVLGIQRPEPFTRMWSWMSPLFFLLGMAGLFGILRLLITKKGPILKALPIIMLAAGMLSSAWALARQFSTLSNPPGYDVPMVTAYIEPILTPDDVVIVSPHIDAIYWYTFDQAGMPETALRGIKQRPFQRAFVIVYPHGRETLEDVLTWVGPDPGFLDMDTAVLLQTFPEAELYAVDANHKVIEETFPVQNQ